MSGVSYTVGFDTAFVGTMPIRKDIEVIPSNDITTLKFGFVGYMVNSDVITNVVESNGITKYNNNNKLWGCDKIPDDKLI